MNIINSGFKWAIGCVVEIDWHQPAESDVASKAIAGRVAAWLVYWDYWREFFLISLFFSLDNIARFHSFLFHPAIIYNWWRSILLEDWQHLPEARGGNWGLRCFAGSIYAQVRFRIFPQFFRETDITNNLLLNLA